MKREFRRAKALGWVLATVAGVFATISGLIIFAFGRHGLHELQHPAVQIFAGIPLALAIGFALLARRYLRDQPVIATLDADGVTIPPRACLPWSDVGEVVVNEYYLGHGPRERITFRARFTSSDIAAKAMERLMHNLFTDRGFAPMLVDKSVEEALAEIDAALDEAGFARVEPPLRRFRILYSSRSWKVEPVSKYASPFGIDVENGTDSPID